MTDPWMEPELCSICVGPLDARHRASCQMCGGKFHQAWSVDADVPQCGHIVSHEEAQALVFLCENCYQTLRDRA